MPGKWNKLCIFIAVFAFDGLLILPVENARILAVETIACQSHWNFMDGILRALTDAGHHVTVFTPFPGGHRANYTEVDTSQEFPLVKGGNLMVLLEKRSHPFSFLNIITAWSRNLCDIVYANGRLREIVGDNSKNDFDVIIVEPNTLDCMSYLANALGLPIIYAIPTPIISYTERTFTGHVPNPACVSNLLARQAVPNTFVQRLTNTAILAYGMFVSKFDELLLQKSDPKSYVLTPTVHPSMIFQNSHYVTDAPRSLPQNLIDVGGIHLKAPKSIPKEILKFIENSPHGVIYFTFGSTVKLSTLSKHILNAFKDALAQVPQRVLWKYEGDMEDKPENMMIKNWFPQRDILLHPNVKLFISHGGIAGVYEAIDAGVPVLGFPIFYDQPRNLDHLVQAGMAISMDLLSVSKDRLLNATLELTNNKKYMENAKTVSQRFKDRPMTSVQSVVYWTEYIIRHKGAPNLMSYSYNLTWYQYFLLDIIGLIIISSLGLLLSYKCSKIIYNTF